MQNSSLKAIPPRGEGAEVFIPQLLSVVVSKCFHSWWGKTRPAVCWGGFSQKQTLSQGFEHNYPGVDGEDISRGAGIRNREAGGLS